MKKAIVFDWDGTLFDSAQYKRDNFVALLSQEGLPPLELRHYHEHFAGVPRRQLFSEAFQRLGKQALDDERFFALSRAYTQMNLESSVLAQVFPDAERFLRQYGHQFQLFVSSSSAHDELVQVVKAKLPDIPFREVLGSRLGMNKGSEHIDFIRQKYAFELGDMIVVGDDEMDLILSERARVDALRIIRENRKGHLQSLEELPNWL